MPLGVSGATPFHMSSNHPTALNHSFRDTSGYEAQKQRKIKCSFCGCWATRGRLCYQCKRPVGGYALPRRNNEKVLPAKSPFKEDSDIRPLAAHTYDRSRVKYADPVVMRPVVARAHTRRAEGGAEAQPDHRVKCKSCGCWAKKSKPCGLCRTVN